MLWNSALTLHPAALNLSFNLDPVLGDLPRKFKAAEPAYD